MPLHERFLNYNKELVSNKEANHLLKIRNEILQEENYKIFLPALRAKGKETINAVYHFFCAAWDLYPD